LEGLRLCLPMQPQNHWSPPCPSLQAPQVSCRPWGCFYLSSNKQTRAHQEPPNQGRPSSCPSTTGGLWSGIFSWATLKDQEEVPPNSTQNTTYRTGHPRNFPPSRCPGPLDLLLGPRTPEKRQQLSPTRGSVAAPGP
jgi:hypothetical protein